MTYDVSVLGPIRVLVDGVAVELGPARRRTLLASLALEPGRVVPVDVLVDRVWDGEPTQSPAATLHAYVSRLRAAFRTAATAAGAGTDVSSGPLVTQPPGYVLDLAPSAVDAHRFATAVQDARAHRAAGDALEAARTVRAGLGLWRGSAYLDVPAEFARQEADRLEELRTSARELAVQLDLDLGRHASVIEEATELLRHDQLREGLHAALVVALYRSGRQAEALDHLSVVRELMAEELGIDPGPELRRLHEQVLRQDPALDLAGPAVPVRPESVGTTTAAAAAPSGPRTRGRDIELDRARSLLADVRAGATATLSVVGEAGIGKSTLVEEVAADAAETGFAVAWGRCWEHEGAPVLWPWIQVVEAIAERLDADALAEALTGRAGAVVSLVPGLAERAAAPAATPPSSTETDQVRLYDAVAAFVERACAGRPLLVALEDMHWADLASRELTEYVVGRVRGVPLAVVVIVRSPTGDGGRVGSELLTALARHGRTRRIDLAGLSADAVRDYVTDRTGSVIDPATCEALTERTAGNPFFIAELVRLLVTDIDGTANTSPTPEMSATVPDSIREVIARRIDRLPEDDRSVLRVAAVVGRSFDLDLIERVAGLDVDAVDEAVDRATALGILRSDPDSTARHVFVHALTQETLLDTTGPARLRRLHARVAAALDDHPDLDDAVLLERLGFHLTSAGGQAELQRAVEIGLYAADLARAHSNVPETEAVLLRILQLCTRLPAAETGRLEMAARVRLWSLYAATEGPGGPREKSQHEEAMRLIALHGGPLDVAAGHQAQLAFHTWTDDLDGMDRLVEEMSAAAEAADDDALRMAALMARGQARAHRGRLRAALDDYCAAAAIIDGGVVVPGSLFPLAPACAIPFWLTILAWLLRETDLSSDALGALEARHARADAVTRAYVDINLAWSFAVRDEPERALRHATRGREAALGLGLDESLKFVDILAAWAQERTQPGTGLDDLVAALARTDPMPTLALRPMLRGLLADVQLRAGRPDDALETLAHALAESDRTGDRLALSDVHRLRAAALTALGAAPREAREALREARRIAEEQGATALLARLPD